MTDSAPAKPLLMLIDDDAQQLEKLEASLQVRLDGQADIWSVRPDRGDVTRDLLDSILARRPTL